VGGAPRANRDFERDYGFEDLRGVLRAQVRQVGNDCLLLVVACVDEGGC